MAAPAPHRRHPAKPHEFVAGLLLPDVRQRQRRGVDVVHRNIEKTLDLVSMQIDRYHPVRSNAEIMVAATFAVIGTRAERGRRSCRA